jgi:peptidoglycan/xylan/chitin deacetylase (PgdA/CDA1 family)
MGDVIISLDAELAWGYHDHPEPPERLRTAREGWTAALELFDRYRVPATWAVVGHLFLDDCDGRHASHPLGPEWFDRDPGGSIEDYDLWYGPDLLEAIARRDVDHEIACHSFSHVEFGDRTTSRATAVAEVTACLRAADRRGVPLNSFVFPRNNVGYRDVLAEYGFECYRGVKPAPSYEDSRLRPVVKLLDWYFGGESPPVVTPAVDEHGLVDVPASLYLFAFEGRPRSLVAPVWDDPAVTVARRGVDRVSDAEGVFHMWLHPHDLLQPDGVERLDAILSYVDERRAEGTVAVRTMREAAASWTGPERRTEVVA